MAGVQIGRSARLQTGTGTTTTLAPYDKSWGQPGMWTIPPWASIQSTGVLATANRGYFVRFMPSRNMTIINASFVVGTAASVDDPCDVGVYDASGNRLASSGSVSGLLNSTGVKTTALSVSLVGGTVYYSAFAYGTLGGTGAALLGASFASALGGSSGFGTALGNAEGFVAATVFPLPATVAHGGVIAIYPSLILKEV